MADLSAVLSDRRARKQGGWYPKRYQWNREDRGYGGGTVWLDSAWYDTAEHLTLHLDDAAIVPKDQDTVLLQEDGRLIGLPDYIHQITSGPYWEANTVCIQTDKGTYHTNTSAFDGYVDADGQTDSFDSISTYVMSEAENTFTNSYPMPQGVPISADLVRRFCTRSEAGTPDRSPYVTEKQLRAFRLTIGGVPKSAPLFCGLPVENL